MFNFVLVRLSLLLFTLERCSSEEVLFSSGEDAVLHCPAEAEPGVSYHSVTWYKVGDAPSHDLSGLLMKRLTQKNGTVEKYKGLMRDVELIGDSQSLLLRNVTQRDAGRYLCFLSAPLGHQHREREILLRIYENQKDENIMMETRERKDEHENDTLFVVLAIILLLVALLMFYCSYICLRNTLISHKEKLSRPAPLQWPQQKRNFMVSLKSNGLESSLLPVVCV